MIKNITGKLQGNKNTTLLLNHLKSAEKQYPILSKDEEKKLIKKYKNDRETLNQLLVMHNLKNVLSQAKKYVGKTDDFDGLVQNGILGLAEAAKRFDITKNIKFITFAFFYIKKYILAGFYGNQNEIDKNSSSLNAQSKNTSSKTLDQNEPEFEDYINKYISPDYSTPIKTVESEVSTNEQSKLCSDLLTAMNNDSSLSSTDKKVFYDIFYNQEKTRLVAEKYDITMATVNDIKHKILSKFKNILQTDYNINSFYQI